MAKNEKMTQLKNEVEKLVVSYNEAYQNAKFDKAIKIDEQLTEKVNEYTSVAREMAFEACKATDDPMLEAIKRLTFTTIGVKDQKDEDTDVPVRVLIEKEKIIDLVKLDKFCKGIGKDKNWDDVIQKFNFLMTYQVATDLGLDPKEVSDSYAMSEIARQIEFGKTPTSNTNMLKTLQAIVNAMIGDEYKATSHDVKFLYYTYARRGRKALTVACANHKNMREIAMLICNRIVEGKTYSVDYKKIK